MLKRRTLVGLGAGGLFSCAHARGDYFGNTKPPASATLFHSLMAEPSTLDPAKSGGDIESYLVPALFEGLTAYHPQRPEPMAGLATHYETSPQMDRFVFFLRGHPKPRGIRLPDIDSLPAEFTAGKKASAKSTAACWSDGRPITAHDFVYSWRRLLEPATASPMAYHLFYIRNAKEINEAKRGSHELAVRAIDDLTLEIELNAPTPFFLQLINQYPFSPVPSHAIEAARARGKESSWTDPANIVVSGAFRLKSWRPNEEITLVRNPRYYDASLVRVEELTFLIVIDGTTTINLYRSGHVSSMPGPGMPPLYSPILSAKKDFHVSPAFVTVFPVMNTRKAPFDNVLLRYALNMATDKKPIVDFIGAGRRPALHLIPPMPGYPEWNTLPVVVNGLTYDVLAFNVEAARSLLAKAGRDISLDISYHYPVLPDTQQKAEILQSQWRRNLGIRLTLLPHEFNVHWQMLRDHDYAGVADNALFAPYYDPNAFLDPFLTRGPENPSSWTDPKYAAMLADANRTLNPEKRMSKLAECERFLLTAMPFLPLNHDVWAYLQKPFIKGLASNPLADIRAFKYAWIDTNWRPN